MDSTYTEDRTFFISRATKKLEDGLFDEASAMADERLARYPGDVDAHIISAIILIRTGRPAEACDILETLDNMIQEWSQIYELLGFVYRKQEAPEAAIRAYKTFLTLNPASPMKGHISNKIDYLMDEVKEKREAAEKGAVPDSPDAAPPEDAAAATVAEGESIPGGADEAVRDDIPPTLEGETETGDTETVTETEPLPDTGEEPAGDIPLTLEGESEDDTDTVADREPLPDTGEEPTGDIPLTLEEETETDDTETVADTEPLPDTGEEPAGDIPLTLERATEDDTTAIETASDGEEDTRETFGPAAAPDSGTESVPEDMAAETLEPATKDDSEPEEQPDVPPHDFDTVTLADLYLQQGHRDMAQDILNRILAKDPEHAEARERLRQMAATAGTRRGPVITELNNWLKNLQR